MKQFLQRISRAFSAEFGRTSWSIFLLFIGGLFISRSGREIFAQQFAVLAWKLVLVGTSVVVAHIARKQLFPYVDVSAVISEKNAHGAIVFLAIAVIYAAIIHAICSGL